ncbi:hypothetical protein Tco_0570071 [Tanacetum coccineum]
MDQLPHPQYLYRIRSQGLPRHVFNILNQTRTGKEIWDNVELLMKGSGKSLQQQKEELFDEYERFRAIGNESIHDYFVRFHKLINDMKITQLNIPIHQMNTKFVNNLPRLGKENVNMLITAMEKGTYRWQCKGEKESKILLSTSRTRCYNGTTGYNTTTSSKNHKQKGRVRFDVDEDPCSQQAFMDNFHLHVEPMVPTTIHINEYQLDSEVQDVPTEVSSAPPGSFDKQALETELTQLKDAITSVRIQNDGFKVENENVKRRYKELSETITHSRDELTGKITALTAENAKLKTELISKISSGSIACEKPKVLAPGMYAISPKYIPPQRRVNRAVPTPLPKKQQVTFKKPPRPSNRPTQKIVVQQNKKPNVPVNLSTGVKPATGASKPMSKSDTRNHSTLPAKMEPIVEPLELTPCVSSSSKVTMISRVTDYTPSDLRDGSKGISGDRSKLINYVDKFIGTVRFGNDQFATIVGYGDYKLGNTIISRVYYVEGLSHNLFSVGQFCDGGLEVAFRQHTTGLEPIPSGGPMHNGARTQNSALHSDAVASERCKYPTTPSVPPPLSETTKNLYQPLFDDDEEFPPAVQIPSVRVNAALAPEMATGSPSITINTEDAPATITSSSESQTPPPDTGVIGIETPLPTNDSDLFEPYIAPDTASAASSSGTVIVDVTLNSQITHVQKWD